MVSGRAPGEPKPTLLASSGAVLLLLSLPAVVTGLALLPFYTATADGAHDSVAAMEASAALRTLRAAHHWASALLVLLGALCLVVGLFRSSYRRPWHVAWIAAVGLTLLFLLFQVTGHLLPWDAHAVSSAVIEAGIAENVPLVGPFQARLIRGGETVSPRTLTIWYGVHVALLPAALAGLAALFILGVRRAATRWTIPRAPAVLVLAVLVVAALAVPAPLGPEATAADYTSYSSPPEWYVLPLHGLLNLAQGIHPRLAFVGTVVIPGLVVLALLALPWLDRRAPDEPASGAVRAAAALGIACVLLLGVTNVDHAAPLFRAVEPAGGPAMATAAPPADPIDPALVEKGRSLYARNGCAGCHKIRGEGGGAGPPLDGVGARQPNLDWQIRHLQDPASTTPGSTMPAYRQLPEQDLRALATYLLSLR